MQRKTKHTQRVAPPLPSVCQSNPNALLGRAQKGRASFNPDSTLGVVSFQISAVDVSDLLLPKVCLDSLPPVKLCSPATQGSRQSIDSLWNGVNRGWGLSYTQLLS